MSKTRQEHVIKQCQNFLVIGVTPRENFFKKPYMSVTDSIDSLFSVVNEGTTVTIENDNYDNVGDGEQSSFTLNVDTV